MESVCTQHTGGSNPPLSATVEVEPCVKPPLRHCFPAHGANPSLSATHIYLVTMGMCASGSCAGVSELHPSAIAYFPMADDPNAADLELVRRIKQGDEEAFREMVERYHARVYSLSYGVLRNAEDAEEATQDTFLTLYRKIGTFDESKKFFSWFYRVALNSAYSRARRRKPAVDASRSRTTCPASAATRPSPQFQAWVDGIEDEVIARDLAERAEGFIAELPDAYRDVIWMVDVEEMRPADVAETLEISIPALKSRLHRARLFVRQRLAEAASAPSPRARASGGPPREPRRDELPQADPGVPRRLRGRHDGVRRARSLEAHLSHCPPCVVFLDTYRATGRTLRMLKPRDIPKNLAEAVVNFVKSRCKDKP